MSYHRVWNRYVGWLASLLMLVPICGNALSLHDAMILAHENNARVLSEYQNMNAARMNKPKAYGEFLPNVSLNHSNFHSIYKDPAVKNAYGSPYYRRDTLNVTQPIFNGGGSYARVKIANNVARSGMHRFYDVANSVAVQAVQAYTSVLTTRDIYKINLQNEEISKKNLEFNRVRFSAGVVTRTDVLQTEVRFSEAIAQRERAYANMRNAEANFEHIIGILPGDHLEPIVPEESLLPKNVDDLIGEAIANNPAVLASKSDAKAAKYQVMASTSNVLPTVSANAQVVRSNETRVFGSSSNPGATYTVQVQVPLFQGGGEYADIQQKRYLARKANLDLDEVRRGLTEACVVAWNDYKTSKTVIIARADAVKTAREALDGVLEEVKVGTKTTLDLLNAQQELFNAQVLHRSAQQDVVISVYQMLQVMGAIMEPAMEYLSEK